MQEWLRALHVEGWSGDLRTKNLKIYLYLKIWRSLVYLVRFISIKGCDWKTDWSR